MNNPSCRGAVLFSVSIFTFAAMPLSAFAHGFAGDRFFPATLTTDDPFAASELSLPTFSEIRQPGQPSFNDFDLSTDISLLLLPNTALTIGDGYNIQKAAKARRVQVAGPCKLDSWMLVKSFAVIAASAPRRCVSPLVQKQGDVVDEKTNPEKE
jgi:hypothetical protein